MTDQKYRRPPITEAVIHIIFDTATTPIDLEKTSNSFSQYYPQHQFTRNVNVGVAMPPAVNQTPKATILGDEVAHRRSSDDQTEILVLWPSSLVFSQLAPYPGWDMFIKRFERDWRAWKKIVGYRKIIRLGTRYINRIDIPVTGPTLNHEEFLKIHPLIPDDIPAVLAYGIQVQFTFPEIDGMILINSSSVPSPILNRASFMFDQDLIKEKDMPQTDEGLFSLLERIHVKKNEIFESCITDKARELFDA